MNDRLPGTKFVVFAVICVLISIGLSYVIGNWRFGANREYTAEFAAAQGLLVNDNVKIAGVVVGKVTEIEATEQGTALVTFIVDEDTPVTDDAIVSIRWRDVFGLRYLYVTPGSGAPAPEGTAFTLASTRGAADLTVLLDRLVPVMTALDPELQNQILEALAEGLVGRDDDVQAIISDGAALTEAIASRDTEIAALIDDTTTIVEAYSARRDDLQSLLGSFADVAESLAERNDLLVSSIVRVADAQEEVDRLLAANDAELRRALDEAEVIVDVLADREDDLDLAIQESGAGLIGYHLVSRLGQWFDIAVPGASANGDPFPTNSRGAALPPEDPDATNPYEGRSSGVSSFFSTGG